MLLAKIFVVIIWTSSNRAIMTKSVIDYKSQHNLLIIDSELMELSLTSHLLSEKYDSQYITSVEYASDLLDTNLVEPAIILCSVYSPNTAFLERYRSLKAKASHVNAPILFVCASKQISTLLDEQLVNAEDSIQYEVIERGFTACDLEIALHNRFKYNEAGANNDPLKHIDHVTGIWNKDRFAQELSDDWSKYQSVRSQLGLLLIDVDHFRHFKLSYGPNYSELVLQMIADELRTLSKGNKSVFAAMNENKYAFLLPECTASELTMVARNILSMVKSLAVKHAQKQSGSLLSVTIGGSVVKASKGTLPSALIDSAELALMGAKNSARGSCKITNNLFKYQGDTKRTNFLNLSH